MYTQRYLYAHPSTQASQESARIQASQPNRSQAKPCKNENSRNLCLSQLAVLGLSEEELESIKNHLRATAAGLLNPKPLDP